MNRDANASVPRSLGMARACGLMHAVVDATSVAVLIWGLRVPDSTVGGYTDLPRDVIWNRYLLYMVLAFGTQFSL